MAWKKGIKKAGRNVRRWGKRRYFGKKKASWKNVKLLQVARDVNTLRGMLNTEKKRIVTQQKTPLPFAQYVSSGKTTGSADGEAIYSLRNNASYSGAFCLPDIIGPITRGTGEDQMVGDKMKMVSYHMDVRIRAVPTGSPIVHSPLKVRVMLVNIKRGYMPLLSSNLGTTSGIEPQEALLTKFFATSAFDSTYDANSPRNFEYMKEFEVIASKNVYIKLEDNELDANVHKPQKQFSFGGKLNHHVRIEKGGDEKHSNQLALIAVADQGSLDDPLDDTHMEIEWQNTIYYVDN